MKPKGLIAVPDKRWFEKKRKKAKISGSLGEKAELSGEFRHNIAFVLFKSYEKYLSIKILAQRATPLGQNIAEELNRGFSPILRLSEKIRARKQFVLGNARGGGMAKRLLPRERNLSKLERTLKKE